MGRVCGLGDGGPWKWGTCGVGKLMGVVPEAEGRVDVWIGGGAT
jgi:hypothetical protein